MDDDFEARHLRRDELVRQMCEVMGWEHSSSHIWTAIRKVAKAEAVAISLDKLEEVLDRLKAKGQTP